MQPPTAVPRVAPGVRRPHLQQARNGHTWWQKKSVRGRSSRHSSRCGSAPWPTQPCPRVPPPRLLADPGSAAARAGLDGGRRGGAWWRARVPYCARGPAPFRGAPAVWTCLLCRVPVRIPARVLLGPPSYPYCLQELFISAGRRPFVTSVRGCLAGCLGGAQPEARGQDTGHSHHNPGAVQTSGLSSAGGPGSPLSTQTAREARVFSPAAAGPG